VSVADTALSVFILGDPVQSGNWGLSVVKQLKDYPDSFLVQTAIIPGGFAHYLNSLVDTIDVREYRSVTIIITATTINPALYYQSNNTPDMAYIVFNKSVSPPDSLINIAAAVLTPYPNPAVVSELGDGLLKFRFQAPTDSTSFPTYETAYLVVDIYTLAGEYVRLVEGNYTGEDRLGEHRNAIYEAHWDMKNQSGRDVTSGAYLTVARLFQDTDKKILLAKDRVKVAVIR